MPDTRAHRGPDPRDELAFGPHALPALRQAVADYSLLIGRGYAQTSTLKLVGDRWSLTERQRMAVLRCSCSDEDQARRLRHEVSAGWIRGQPLLLDGFNVLMTVEAALGGAVVLAGRDGAFRDLCGVHGTYRRVEETLPAIHVVSRFLGRVGVNTCRWLLDRPVSNSGRLRALLLEAASESDWDWEVELVQDPDPILAVSPSIIATADSAILDRCSRWFSLARHVIEAEIPQSRVLDLETNSPSPESFPI